MLNGLIIQSLSREQYVKLTFIELFNPLVEQFDEESSKLNCLKALVLPVVPEDGQEGLLIFQEVEYCLLEIEEPLLELSQGRVILVADDLVLCVDVREVLCLLAFHHGLVEFKEFCFELFAVNILGILSANQFVNLLHKFDDSLLND